MMSTGLDSDSKIKMLEMHAARLERSVTELELEVDEIKRYLVKLVAHQTQIADQIRRWPFVYVSNPSDKNTDTPPQ